MLPGEQQLFSSAKGTQDAAAVIDILSGRESLFKAGTNAGRINSDSQPGYEKHKDENQFCNQHHNKFLEQCSSGYTAKSPSRQLLCRWAGSLQARCERQSFFSPVLLFSYIMKQ